MKGMHFSTKNAHLLNLLLLYFRVALALLQVLVVVAAAAAAAAAAAGDCRPGVNVIKLFSFIADDEAK